MTRRMTTGLALATVLLVGRAAQAQDVALPEPVAGPTAKEGEPEIALDTEREIDLANVVTSAAKGVTTVQEAPAIITILTSDELKARGFRYVEEALQTIPGWMNISAFGNQVPVNPTVRGLQQAMLLLRDGVSMFEPFANNVALRTTIPIESIKRIEVVTGPGGVLWGSNSFLGIVNIIMKDAEDVNGLEVSAGYGDGPGNRSDVRAYALFGKSFFKGKLKIFQHLSYENFIGPTYNISSFIASSPAPQITGGAFYGALAEANLQRSWTLVVDGKYSVGPVSLYYSLPFGEHYTSLSFANAPNNNNRVIDLARYAILEYKDRFWKDRYGISIKGYWSQFVTSFSAQLQRPWAQFPPFTNPDGTPNPGGIHFTFQDQYQALVQRTGLTLDNDIDLKHGLKFLFGGEFFYEGIANANEVIDSAPYGDLSMAPAGTPLTATPNGYPLVCPQHQNPDGSFTAVARCPRSFVNDQYRLVAALYADLQWRPVSQLSFDAGIRVQKAFGGRTYDFTPLYSAAAVWNFLPDYHLKLNYTTGFRAPPFNATDSAGGAILFGSNPNLKNESSQSFQGELNARLLRNVRKVRELVLRVDYSYTFLDKVITFNQGNYTNTGQRAIHSVEAYGKLYLNGDHFLTASYTFLFGQSTDAGTLRNFPHHWVSLGASFNLIKNTLDVNANLLVTGAYQDPNRYPGQPGGGPGITTTARSSDLTFDRLTPVALLQLGFRLRFLKEKLGISGQFYNVLNQRYWVPDPFNDLRPSIEMTPTPAAGFSFFASAAYHF